MSNDKEILETLKEISKNLKAPAPQTHAGLLTSDQLAERWKVSERKIRDMKGAGKIPYIMIDGSVRFPIKEIELIEARNTVKASGY
jgi:hypothetical protein